MNVVIRTRVDSRIVRYAARTELPEDSYDFVTEVNESIGLDDAWTLVITKFCESLGDASGKATVVAAVAVYLKIRGLGATTIQGDDAETDAQVQRSLAEAEKKDHDPDPPSDLPS